MRKLLALGVVVVGLLLAGCKSTCRQLSESMCECSITTSNKTACLQVAATNEQNNYPTAADEANCAALLPLCDCRLIDTAQGKANCGLTRPLADPDAGT
jgi:hypothetical protein